MDNEKIVKSIKMLCQEHNITANQLENKVGLSQGLISRWLKTTPSLDKIIDIADYFNVTLDAVIGRHEEIDMMDDFMKALIEITENGGIEWIHKNNYNPFELYDRISKGHTPKNYYAQVNENEIEINAAYSNDMLNPYELHLYFTINTTKTEQKYSYVQLLQLWKTILFSLKNKPDEIEAELFKKQIIELNNKRAGE